VVKIHPGGGRSLALEQHMTFDTNIPRDRGRSRFRLSPSRIGLCAILAALAMASPAHAHPDTRPQKPSRVGAPPPSAAAERPTRWYGYQGAIADAAAGALLYGAISTFRLCFSTCDNSTATLMLLGSLGTYAFGAPVIHVTHGRVDKAALSFGMRVTPWIAAAPLVSA
jgi:hypothetical protein